MRFCGLLWVAKLWGTLSQKLIVTTVTGHSYSRGSRVAQTLAPGFSFDVTEYVAG